MRKIFFFFLLVVVGFMFSGCNTLKNTLKGAGEGAKKDWEVLKRWDKKMQENWW